MEHWKITIGASITIHHANSLVDRDHPEFDYDMYDGLEGMMLLNNNEISQEYYEEIRNFTKTSQNTSIFVLQILKWIKGNISGW